MCHFCMHEFMVIHSWEDKQDACIHCEATEITKLLTRPLKINSKEKQKESVGNITKEYIEANKEVLEDLKESSKSENYDPS